MSSSLSTNATRASLLERVIARDDQAWRQFVSLYGPLIAHWCRGCCLDSLSTADVMQEVFMAVSGGIDRFRSSPGSGAFRGWLWSITRNKVIDWHRNSFRPLDASGGSDAQKRLQNLIDPISIPEEEPSSDDALTELTRRALLQIEHEFQPRTWAAFWRSAVDGLTSEQVASDLQITAATVRQARSRILRRLRKYLADTPPITYG